MARVLLDVDPRLLAQLRALANRRGVTVDQVVNEVLRSALPAARRAAPADPCGAGTATRPQPRTYDYDDPDVGPED